MPYSPDIVIKLVKKSDYTRFNFLARTVPRFDERRLCHRARESGLCGFEIRLR